ncbi:flagellar basal body L-ring protein FlgH [Legionella sp. CNM-4043-24]|uniref:flagellar basal body L-ring protein FlgH n=1 Tax=Legionella sp. CNM-4043-24 TaxID=3421646 RepID=UPI00403AC9BE
MWIKKAVRLLATGAVVALSGCFNQDVYLPPVMPLDVPPPPKVRGTIYQPGFEVLLYEDRIARRVGDVLTIRLEEATQGEYRARTRTDKKAILNYPVPILFGKSVPALEVDTNTEQKFDSMGNSDQSNRLRGTISVTVVRMLPNSNMVVQGESWVTINQGQEFIQLTGIVRPEDIGPNNIVSSQRVAAAQIRYGARGQAGYATRGGLMTKLFNRFAPY